MSDHPSGPRKRSVPGSQAPRSIERPANLQRGVDDEIAFHLASRAEDLVRRGVSREAARRTAEEEFGNVELARTQLTAVDRRIATRARRAARWEALAHDAKYALRFLMRRSRFSVVAVLTIALGIAATASVYSIVDRVLLRPLPFRDAARLVRINQVFTAWKGDAVLGAMWDRIPLGVGEYETLRDRNTVFDGVAIWGSGSASLSTNGRGEIVPTTFASASLLDVLGVRPLRGTMWHESDDVVGGPRLALIGFDEWQTRFGANPDAVGQVLRLGDNSYQIIGVLPPGLRLELADAPVSFLLPVGQSTDDHRAGNRSYAAVARLKPGTSREHAEIEARHILDRDGIANGRKTVRVTEWHAEQTRESRRPLLMLLSAVGVLLAIACVNVAMLLLGESSTRQHELAARMALGAGWWRVVQQLWMESLVLSVAGSSLGALLAVWGTKLFVAMAPARIPGLERAHVDSRVLGVVAVISTINGLLFGLVPALTLSHVQPSSVLRVGSGQTGTGSGRLQFVLVALQLACSAVLLVGAGLLGKSLLRITAIDPGFRADHLIVARVVPPLFSRTDSARERSFFEDAVAVLSTIPGVGTVSAASAVPFDGGSSSSNLEIIGRDVVARAENHDTQQRVVLPNYFAVMGMPLTAGRGFTPTDRGGGELVMVANEALARREFPAGGAIGARVKFHGQVRVIVGIVRDTRFRRLAIAPEPTVYTPFGQGQGIREFVVRTAAEPKGLVTKVRTTIAALPGNPTVRTVTTMDERVRTSYAEERFRATLVLLFGVLAALLASVGMYGVASRAAARRNREIGIRVALGATRASVMTLAIRTTISAALVGVAVGLATSAAVAPRILEFLFDVNPYDWSSYCGSAVLLLGVAIVGTWGPAHRAGRTPPTLTLRSE